MKIFAMINTASQIIDLKAVPTLLDGYIEMRIVRPDGIWHAKDDGEWHAGDPEVERDFIKSEIELIADELLKHEDSDPAAIATEKDWRNYRIELRGWNWDNKKFPNPKYRPKRPR